MGRTIDTSSIKQPGTNGIKLHWMFVEVRRVAIQVALLLAFFITPVLAQGPAGKDLRAFYQQNCASCHGPDGSAVSAEGEKLSGQDFTDQGWQRRTRDDEMIKTILKGKFFGLAMPSFEDALTTEEVQQIVTEIIRKAKKGHMVAPDAKGPGEK
jgi:mono/diheme cytochrome c family protein